MPMNEYGEIIRNSSPPPPIPSGNNNNHNNNSNNNSSGGSFIAIIVGIVILVAVIWLIASATNSNNSNKYSSNTSQNTTANYTSQPQVTDEPDTYYEEPEVVEEEYSDEYILPYSDSEYISYSDLYGLSQTEVSLARNEIYARHGRKFNTDSIRQYFESQSWYNPRINPDDFSESVFNNYEKENIKTIVNYEKEKGWK